MQYKKLKAETADFVSSRDTKPRIQFTCGDVFYQFTVDDLSIALLGEQIAAHTATLIRKKLNRRA